MSDTSPGKMELGSLAPMENRLAGVLKSRVALQSVPDVTQLDLEVSEAPEERPASQDVSSVEVEAPVQAALVTADTTAPAEVPKTAAPTKVKPPKAKPSKAKSAKAKAKSKPAKTKVEPVEEEHSGHVTLYLPGAVNQWLAAHHKGTEISYPGIVLNAISWAAKGERFATIFAPVDSPIPADDLFGRAPTTTRPSRGEIDPETRPLRFRKDHMQVIIGLARTWTADNRNAFFAGVLSAYKDAMTEEQPPQDDSGVQQ